MAKPFTITTAIDYVTAEPHLGHAYEKIATDVMTRYQRLLGKNVFFLTGTDEHGTKVATMAAKNNLTPQAYADKIAASYKHTWGQLNVVYDRFIRTTEADHTAVVQHIWQTLLNKGDIYKADYTGQYCAGCESFLAERDITEDGLCSIHGTQPDAVSEENYFFKLTAYKEDLFKLINGGKFVQPDFRVPELLNILENLQDISVSRPVSSVSWGIPVPNDPDQRIYVWIDALSNYITGTGYLSNPEQFATHWPAGCHMIGKDILKFHALYWVAILMAAELPLPRMVYAHGFINVNDAKISKTVGNVVAPQDLMKRFELDTPDPIRYYLMTLCPFGQDGNFTEDDFKAKVNADLANNVGNLLNRTLNMTKKYCGGVVPNLDRQQSILINKPEQKVSLRYEPVAEEDLQPIKNAMAQYQFQRAAESIIHLVDRGNKLVHNTEPWTLHKEGKQADLEKVLYTVLDSLRQVAILLSPFTPELCERIWQQLGYAPGTLAQKRWDDVLGSAIPAGQILQLSGPILPRLEDELVGAAGKKG